MAGYFRSLRCLIVVACPELQSKERRRS